MIVHLSYKHKAALLFGMLLATQDVAVAKEAKIKSKGAKIVINEAVADKTDKTHKQDFQIELEKENALNRALLEKKLAGIMAQIEQLRLEKERKRLHKEAEEEHLREAHDKAMRLLNMEKERLVMELELAQAKFSKKMEQYSIQIAELDKKVQLERGQTQLMQETKSRLQAEIEVLHAKADREKRIEKKPIYLKDPLRKKDNVLVLSDRCIELNGDIMPWSAQHIVDKIQFFNNKNSEYPIFLIIGHSPGGWVISGWNILQAIEHSKAPVYVVVKEFAFSMAALITTLAKKSYVYPNAIILHHQPISYTHFEGNVRQRKEAYERLNNMWKRLGGKVAKKMGISLKAFEKKLYEKDMQGAWEEYADNAKKLKWVDVVIHGIEDSAASTLPDAAEYTLKSYIKKLGWDQAEGMQPEEAMRYNALMPYDFDYSYRPNQKAQVMGKP